MVTFIEASILFVVLFDDSETWQSFSVRAAAGGGACLNSPNHEGDAVLITHNVIEGESMHTYYGHLDEYNANIPDCGEGLLLVEIGDIIGQAGSNGMSNDSYIHLHFQLKRNDEPIDPYDIYGTREFYPDAILTNARFCGENSMFFTEVCPRSQSDIFDIDSDDNYEDTIEDETNFLENRERYVESTAFEALTMAIKFVDLLQSGQIHDIDEAYFMQVTQEQFNSIRGLLVRRASYADLERCSEQMINGEMQLMSFTNRFSPRIELSELEIFNRERGLGGLEVWRVAVSFRYREWGSPSVGRHIFKDYDPLNHKTEMYFSFFDGELKMTANYLCKSGGSPLTVPVNYIPGR